MADAVNLDALIPREDFIAPPDDTSAAGEIGKQSASATDLTRGESMHLDHALEISSGGIDDIENGQWVRPYCDSTYKRYLQAQGAPL